MTARLIDPVRHCGQCGVQLIRKRAASGRLEAPTVFAVRQFCSKACSAAAHSGERHPLWAGEDASIYRVHRRMDKVRGKATTYQCVDCGEPAAEWSYTGGDPNEKNDHKGHPYSPDPGFYVPRCRPCHRRFDWRRSGRLTREH